MATFQAHQGVGTIPESTSTLDVEFHIILGPPPVLMAQQGACCSQQSLFPFPSIIWIPARMIGTRTRAPFDQGCQGWPFRGQKNKFDHFLNWLASTFFVEIFKQVAFSKSAEVYIVKYKKFSFLKTEFGNIQLQSPGSPAFDLLYKVMHAPDKCTRAG